jgi:hypothetical protein
MHTLRDYETTLCSALSIVLCHKRGWNPSWTAFSSERGHDDAVGEVHGTDTERSEELAGVGEGTHHDGC